MANGQHRGESRGRLHRRGESVALLMALVPHFRTRCSTLLFRTGSHKLCSCPASRRSRDLFFRAQAPALFAVGNQALGGEAKEPTLAVSPEATARAGQESLHGTFPRAPGNGSCRYPQFMDEETEVQGGRMACVSFWGTS